MKLLLDTHTFLWLVQGNSSLSAPAAMALADTTNDLFLSVASVWELAIKTTNPKRQLVLAAPLEQFVAYWTRVYGLHELAIRMPHALEIAQLPDHHRDPFDRILIAQARVEGMTLLSIDSQITRYQVPVLW